VEIIDYTQLHILKSVTVLYPSLQKQLLLFENSLKKNRVLKHECAVICHVPRHDSPNEGTASYRYLHALSLLPGGSDDVGRNVPKHCLLTWQRHPRSSVGVQGAYNTRHPLPKLQDRKLVPVSCLAGDGRECQKMISW